MILCLTVVKLPSTNKYRIVHSFPAAALPFPFGRITTESKDACICASMHRALPKGQFIHWSARICKRVRFNCLRERQTISTCNFPNYFEIGSCILAGAAFHSLQRWWNAPERQEDGEEQRGVLSVFFFLGSLARIKVWNPCSFDANHSRLRTKKPGGLSGSFALCPPKIGADERARDIGWAGCGCGYGCRWMNIIQILPLWTEQYTSKPTLHNDNRTRTELQWQAETCNDIHLWFHPRVRDSWVRGCD